MLVALLYALSASLAQAGKESSYLAEHPELSLDDIKVSSNSFWEDFQSYANIEEFKKSWISSDRETNDRYTGEVVDQYPVKWGIEESYLLPGFNSDKGMVTYHEKAFAMIGRILEKPITVKDGESLVVQYEMKVQTELECGGAFLKLLPPVNEAELGSYGSTDSPILELLFGPDHCNPYTDEIHLGFRKNNPISGEPELKFLENAPSSRLGEDLLSHLYTLIIDSKSQDFEIRYDGEVVHAGNLLDEGAFEPPFGAPKTIPNPDAVKPEAWDDRETIPDEDQKKPENWDDRPTVEDPEDVKPENWDEFIPEFIAEPERVQPKWWNAEEDGKWVAPLITNPICAISGCGKWQPKMISNPEYKGEWEQPTKKNPEYMGAWKPEEIKNPNYYEDKQPAKLNSAIGAVLFEFWSGSIDLLFDNIYIGKSVEEAEMLGNKTFLTKRALEEQELKLGGGKSIPLPSSNEEEVEYFEAVINYITELTEPLVTYGLSLSPLFLGLTLGSIVVGTLLVYSALILKIFSALHERDDREELKKKNAKKEETDDKKSEDSAKTTGAATKTSDSESEDASKLTSRVNAD